jgi:hypothetical protein
MRDESILNTIIADNQIKDLSNFNVVEAVVALLEQLNKREQDVLKRRFGLLGEAPETLESIGQRHKLTRERIRQIESGGVNKIKKSTELEARLGRLRQLVAQLAEEHGGLMSKNYLFTVLNALAPQGGEAVNHEPYFEFVLSRLFNDHFDEVNNSRYFNSFYKLKYQSLEHLEAAAAELIAEVKNLKKLMDTAELIELVKQLKAYQANQAKFTAPNNFEVKEILSSAVNDYNDTINDNRVVYALLDAMSDIARNKYGHWGHRDWREISPKTINDKIYLVLKQHGQPMYYGDIAANIAQMSFDGKKVNTATTHNELILDDKYVLVGRGLYGLKEWGYKAGTVADVIADILKEAAEPLTKEEITERVLAQRLVKQTTVNLALMNKNRFERTREGKYKLKENKV